MKNKSSQNVWLIGKWHKHKMYLVHDVDVLKNTTAIVWGVLESQAIQFTTHRAVEEFMKKYLKNRNDIFAVNIDIDDE
jgi:hypothetical protein